jgi:type I restriction enzyme R subunit
MRLATEYPLGEPIVGEDKQKEFIKLLGAILKMRNVLLAFDEFEDNEILPDRDFQDYQGVYLDLRDKFRPNGEREEINDDIVFELELIRQVEVNIDYILILVVKYKDSNCKDKNILDSIYKAVRASVRLRSKKELIEEFISRVNITTQVDEDWQRFVREEAEKELQALISDEKLKGDETRKFIENAFREGSVKTTGTDVDKILPPVSRFGSGNRPEKKQGVIAKLMNFFEKYFGVI